MAKETAEVKKTRKPREKVRPVEETFNLPVKKLTDKEKEQLINFLKEQVNLFSNQQEAYKQNAESAFEKARKLEEQMDAVERFYRGKLKFVDTQVTAFHAAINEAIKGGIE